jgi:hypothetical protein
VLSAEPLAGLCVIPAFPERRWWGSKERAQRDAGDAARQSQENGRTQHIGFKSSQVNTLPKAKSKTRSKQNKDMHKCSCVYSERGVPLPVLTSGGE